MKRRVKQKQFLSLLLLVVFVVYAMVLQFAVPDLVLCVGEEGHLAVEPTRETCILAETEHVLITSRFASRHSQIERETPHCRDIDLSVLGVNSPLVKKTLQAQIVVSSPIYLQSQKKEGNDLRIFASNWDDFVISEIGNMLASTFLLI